MKQLAERILKNSYPEIILSFPRKALVMDSFLYKFSILQLYYKRIPYINSLKTSEKFKTVNEEQLLPGSLKLQPYLEWLPFSLPFIKKLNNLDKASFKNS